jgi:uncharacterized alpha-E superfamily protein
VLSRTADHVYWLGRYAERAENLARMLDVQYTLSLLPHNSEAIERDWRLTLDALRLEDAYTARHDEFVQHKVVDFLAFDRQNPTSIVNCLRAARENARAVRGSITSEIWEVFNATWLETRAYVPSRFSARNVAECVEWVKYRAHVARGAVLGSMLRDEAYHFMQLGTFLERTDAVARMLRVGLARSSTLDDEAAGADFHPWSVLLRSLSAFEIFRRVSRDRVTPLRVVEFMVFRDDVPRSVYRSMKQVYDNLRDVANDVSGETQRRAGEFHALLRYGRFDSVVAAGLVAFLDDVLARTADLSDRIGRDFLGHSGTE